MEYTYKFTDKEILEIIKKLYEIKENAEQKLIIIDLLMQGGGR